MVSNLGIRNYANNLISTALSNVISYERLISLVRYCLFASAGREQIMAHGI